MRLILGLIWLLHWLPLPILGRIGEVFGEFLFLLMRERRKITLTNLSLCLPALSTSERHSMARAHFRAYARSVLERGVLWWGSPGRLRRLIEVEPFVPTQSSIERPTIFLCPHFVCLEVAGVAITMQGPLCSIYTQQRSKVFDQALREGRSRFATKDEADRFLLSRRSLTPRSHDRSHAGISHERLARRRYAPCPRFWRLLFDPWSFRDTRRLANPEVSDGDVTLGWPWDAADRVFGPYGVLPP